MPKFLYLLLLAAAVAGGWYLHTNYEIEGLDDVSFKPRTDGQATGGPKPSPKQGAKQPGKGPERHSIRLATFNLGPLDQNKLANRKVAGYLVKVIRQFDVLAVQNVQARNQSPLVTLVEQLNTDGRQYDFAAPDVADIDPAGQYTAFLFDREMIEIDRSTVYPVRDSGNMLRRSPLVSSFRIRGVDTSEAFTFTLINVHNDPIFLDREIDLLDDVFRAVRDDRRGEDDVILLGDLGTDDQQSGELAQLANITWSVSGTPSMLRAPRLVDNILFDRMATVEFTGRAGVLDLMVELNLPMREALEVAEHFPVWAEFSVYEGGQAGHVAASSQVNRSVR